MKADIKEKWVAALRSGEYDQAREQLKVGDAFCCLGVLCQLHSQAVKGFAWAGCEYDGKDGDLPYIVREWAGLNDETDMVAIGGKLALLAQHNDGDTDLARRTFKELANAIEAQL